MEKGFVSTMRKGFHMTFPNGLTASVQWGAGNYCDNQYPEDEDFSYSKNAKSDTAEVAVWCGNSDFLNPQLFFDRPIYTDGAVAGWLTPSEVVEFLANVRDCKTIQEILEEGYHVINDELVRPIG